MKSPPTLAAYGRYTAATQRPGGAEHEARRARLERRDPEHDQRCGPQQPGLDQPRPQIVTARRRHLCRHPRIDPGPARLDVVRVRERPAIVVPAPRKPRRPDREKHAGRDQVAPRDPAPRERVRAEPHRAEHGRDQQTLGSRQCRQRERDRRPGHAAATADLRRDHAVDRERDEHREQLGLEPARAPAREPRRAGEQQRRHHRPRRPPAERTLAGAKHHVERRERARGPEHARADLGRDPGEHQHAEDHGPQEVRVALHRLADVERQLTVLGEVARVHERDVGVVGDEVVRERVNHEHDRGNSEEEPAQAVGGHPADDTAPPRAEHGRRRAKPPAPTLPPPPRGTTAAVPPPRRHRQGRWP